MTHVLCHVCYDVVCPMMLCVVMLWLCGVMICPCMCGCLYVMVCVMYGFCMCMYGSDCMRAWCLMLCVVGVGGSCIVLCVACMLWHCMCL